jgi:hypothetical protein
VRPDKGNQPLSESVRRGRQRGRDSGLNRQEWTAWWKRRGLDQLSLILWAVWDPIGGDVPTDEYVSYAPHVIGMLHDGRSEDEIAAWLRAIRIERMGPDEDGQDSQDREAAHRAKEWYAREMHSWDGLS